MLECAFCDRQGIAKDGDLDMWLCYDHFAEMNSVPENFEEEVWAF